jgi:tetratricopeptide (TPR) repeat protein
MDKVLFQQMYFNIFELYRSNNYEQVIQVSNKMSEQFPEERDGEISYIKARAFFNLTRYEEAIVSVDDSIECNPYKVMKYKFKALCYLKLDKIDEARQCFAHAIKTKRSNDSKKFYNRALRLSRQSMFMEAIKYFDLSIELDSTSSITYYKKAIAFFNLQKYLEVVKLIDLALFINKNYDYFKYGPEVDELRSIAFNNLNKNHG